MSGINKVFLIGHLGKGPDLRHLDNGDAVASFPLVTSEMICKGDQQQVVTEWHNIVMWRSIAESSVQLIKGQLVYIEGKLRTRNFTDRSGIKRYVTEIAADHFEILN
ncbi:single-strand DNA-binding protein [Mucilaginibacter gossypiicola]|uniref:Single-stranded DNA-binding protein n=1 Tax=Mucilaginibacter gossypiicola TaxID=551995 RepID=A0A1H8KS71_9SPHI|nr:single-stranded DNA-binding protein [Mucilaginibacter gossypiicola]SEN95258.1 single-strand DNA-binding protein [Mucilaginibacter gossypiicola]